MKKIEFVRIEAFLTVGNGKHVPNGPHDIVFRKSWDQEMTDDFLDAIFERYVLLYKKASGNPTILHITEHLKEKEPYVFILEGHIAEETAEYFELLQSDGWIPDQDALAYHKLGSLLGPTNAT